MADWSKHSGSFYQCNVYETKKQENDGALGKLEATMEEAAAKIKRYNFYFERSAHAPDTRGT